MESVKKYEAHVMGMGGDYWPEMQESASGGFVAISDYEALLAKTTRPAPCEHACESKAFEIEIRQLKEKVTDLQGVIDKDNAQEPVELHMADAMDALKALKIDKLNRRVDRAELGAMGSIEIVDYSSKIGGRLEMHSSNGGCTLKIYRPVPAQQSPAVAVPDGWSIDDIDHPNKPGYILRGNNGRSICVWSDMQPVLFAFLKSIACSKSSPRITEQDGECVHEWVSAVNKVVRSGEICLKCFALRAGASE